MRTLSTHHINGRGLVVSVELDDNGPLAGDALRRRGRLSRERALDDPRRRMVGAAARYLADGRGTLRPGNGHVVGLLVDDRAPFVEGDEVAIERA